MNEITPSTDHDTYQDREPQPSDGPDYPHDHSAWERRQSQVAKLTEENRRLRWWLYQIESSNERADQRHMAAEALEELGQP